jgi:hypothetical protein
MTTLAYLDGAGICTSGTASDQISISSHQMWSLVMQSMDLDC